MNDVARSVEIARTVSLYIFTTFVWYHTVPYFWPYAKKKKAGRPSHRRDIWLDGVEAHEGPRNIFKDNQAHWLISTQRQTPRGRHHQ